MQRYRALVVFLQLAWFYNKYNADIKCSNGFPTAIMVLQ